MGFLLLGIVKNGSDGYSTVFYVLIIFSSNLDPSGNLRSFEKGETQRSLLPGCVGMKRVRAAFVVVLVS